MRVLGTVWFFVTLVSLTQVKDATGSNCNITSITSTAASSLLVKWNSFPSATSYLLDVRVVNSTTIAPVTVQLASSFTEKLVQGLRPGHYYIVTLKVFQFYYVMCINSLTARTVPATSQITFSKAISSTSIRFEWSSAFGADEYILGVDQSLSPSTHHEQIFITLSGQVDNLQPSTAYKCYIHSSNAAGLGAKSLVKTIRTLVQPPDGVTVAKVSQSRARVSWNSVPTVLLYHVTVSANNKPSIDPVTWNATTTALEIPNLVPCTTYTIGVSSISMFLEPGEPSNVNYTTPNILPVTEISAEYNCMGASASVTWGAVFGATSYRAVARDDQGTTHNCTSTSTSCQISTLSCGTIYTVQVIAVSDCESISNASYVFETAPCPPANPAAYRECSSNVILYSWAATNNTAYYMATALDSDGDIRECLTVDTSCYFTNMMCGKNYSFTVSSYYSGELNCNSGNTNPLTVVTAPCLPHNVYSTADCSIGTAIASWDQVEGAQSYVVEARGNRKDFYNCTSQGTSCMLTGLECGESLSVWIIAKNEFCSTDPVLGEVAETVPCPPQNVSAVETCSSTSATLSWITSSGAVFYISVATHSNGTVHTCVSMATDCEFQDLRCGETYDAYVLATNMQCNSSNSEHVTLRTAPCAPVGVGVVRDCGVNQATVSWQTLQAGGQYTAVMENANSPSLNCSTIGNTCNFPNLSCGLIYNVSVTYHDGNCSSLPSTVNQIRSAPCDPQNITSVLQCDTNVATVTWNASIGAYGYTAMAYAAGQQQSVASCRTNGTSCQLTSLPCGMRLNVTVQTQDPTCNSSAPTIATAIITTAPCAPTNVTASLNCTSKIASISWNGALAFTGYLVTAEGSNGHISSCNTTDTRCDITDLSCGQEYSITVVVKNDDCMSQASHPVILFSAPCQNTGIQAMLDCRTNTALITWTPGNGTLGFNATLHSTEDSHQHSCTTNSSSCNVTSLHCGERYNVSVTGYGQSCATSTKTLITVDTAPCVPTQVNVSLSCQSDTATISWTASSGLVLYYVATAEGANGQTLTCNSSSTTCNISSLLCGQTYNVSVTAVGANCTAERSAVYRVKTAPCAPVLNDVILNCTSRSAEVRWSSSGMSVDMFSVSAVDTQGGQLGCSAANGSSCVVAGLQCGQTYTFSVNATQGQCTSSVNNTLQRHTGPCPPQNIQSVTNCGNNTASVSWSRINGSVSSLTTLECSNGQTYICRTTATGCDITNMPCGQICTVKVAAEGSSCNSSIGIGPNITTAPCVPQNLSASVSCSNNTATVSWGSSQGAVLYSVTASSVNGSSANCTSGSTSCVLSPLTCGERYMVTVRAVGTNCSSEVSAPVQIQAGPCPPQNIQSVTNCGNNTASVSWSRINGSVSSLTTLECSNGQTYICRTTATGCDITNMPCGQICTVKVAAEGSSCNSSIGIGPNITTTPCVPQNLSASVSCSNNTATVSWGSSQGAVLYSVTASSVNGSSANCTSGSTSCVLSPLTCGERYTVTVRAVGTNCSSEVSAPVQIQAGPCPPQNIQSVTNCGNNTASVSWSRINGSVSSLTTLECSNGQTYICRTTATGCDITNMPCGQICTVKVAAEGSSCNSSIGIGPNITTAPCVPQNLSASVSCSNNTSTVSWGSSQGAVLYSVTASSVNGSSANCTSGSTSCVLSPLTCGERYMVTVRAVGTNCSSEVSASVQIQAGPCPPQNIQSVTNCGNNTASVSWSRINGSVSSVATLECSNGQTYICRTTATGCDITNMPCGQICTVKVAAEGSSCNSSIGIGPNITTTPCVPQNLSASVSCSNNTATVSWGSSQGAVLYSVTASSVNGSSANCTSGSTSCVLSPLTCGERYTVTVRAVGTNCSSEVSAPVQIQAGPCPPQNIQSVTNCGNNTASVSWSRINGSVSSLTTLECSNGQTYICRTTATGCDITNMPCGQICTVKVAAEGSSCNSSIGIGPNITTTPCVPQNLSASVSCSINTSTVSWGSSQGAVLYSVTASSVNGSSANCTSGSTSCVLSPLTCGERYTVTVRAVGTNCSSEVSAPVQIQAAPCVPQNLSASVSCSNNTATVSWGSSQGAVLYSVTASSVNGSSANCTSGSTSCVLSPLTCGERYMVTVRAVGTNCSSEVSPPVQIQAGPCPPQNIQSVTNCGNNTASVSWSRINGSVSSLTTLECSNGQTYICRTTATGCDITNMPCGQICTVKVAAEGSSCNSSIGIGPNITTTPCVPQNLSASVSCSNNTATVSWGSSQGAVLYSVTASSVNGSSANCTSGSTSCVLSPLTCGERYMVTVRAVGTNCSSEVSAPVQIQAGPCPPQNIQSVTNCGNNTASVSWSRINGSVSSVVTLECSNGQTYICRTTATGCDITNMPCGQICIVKVAAEGSSCNSSIGIGPNITTTPCVPQNLSASVSCSNNTATVSWGSSQGAVLYSVTASSVNGSSANCTSGSTSCVLSPLTCGERYMVTVRAVGTNCSSEVSAPVQIQAGPCPPQNIQSVTNCGNNTASVSWSRINGSVSSLTTLECSNGQTYICRTTATGCDITNMPCGQICTVKVAAEGSSCNSSIGIGPNITTTPCVPQNLSASVSCSNNTATVSWGSSQGAVLYSVTASSVNSSSANCTSGSTSCVLSPLTCGERYTVTVRAVGTNCSSEVSAPVQIQAGPCPPQNIRSVTNCGNNTASVSWSRINGSVSSLTTLECSNGQTYICRTTATGCDITNMPCGQICTVKVAAEGSSCNSSIGIGPNITTTPCVPQNLSASVSCSNNTATVSWGSSQGAVLYSVTASSVNGSSANCTSGSTSCVLSPLTCGERYTVTVRAVGTNCSSEVSAPVEIQAVPCTPQNVLSTVNCTLNALVVSWTPSSGGQYYTATLQDSNGLSTSCQSSGSQCNITGLRCGQQYSVNMTASDNLCTSLPSTTVNTESVPCAASSIRATLDCLLGTATVSWQYGAGAQGYVVSALGSVGHRATCTSNSSVTNCELSTLQCGDSYGVTVQTLGNPCNASAQMNGSLITGPCASQHLTVRYSPSIAQLFWNSTRTTNFTAVGVTEQGLTVSCNTSSTTCALSGLECGQIYNITLTAHSSVCDSTVDSDPFKTEPCPPQNVRANINCPRLNATVTWEPSRFAVGYAAFLEGQNGHSTSCRTNQTYCSIPGLTCGTFYYVRVYAIGEVFNSSESIAVNMTSAPCVPTNMSAIVDCASDSALVSWSASVGAGNYSVTALGSGGQEVSCSTQQNHCNISTLFCGQLYELTLTSTNQQCEITSTTNVILLSKPCAPLRAAVNKACGNDTVVLSWQESEGVDYYSARALSQGGQEKLCNSTSSVCSFSNLLCGETYAFTVTAYSGRCQSNTSVPEYLTTDPCRPENVTAHVSCDSNTVRLDWSNARGVSLFNVMATGSLGYSHAFNTSTNNLSVSLPCGQSYNVTVQGQNQDCDSPLSAPALFILAPCAPLDLVTYVECTDETGAVSWGSSDGANMYTATATGQDGHTHLCVTNGTSCTWEDLHCGESYNVTVTANDSRCTSPRSNTTYIHMAPCVPQAVMPALDCGTGVATLNWASSAGAETYNVSADNGAGHTLQFSTNVTNGFLSNLLCGKTYLITVSALNRQCRSAPSSPADMWSVPCVPQSVVSALDCLSNSALVQWNISQGAESYLVVATGTDGHTTKCNATAPQCNLQALHCSTSYNISVIAVKQQCNTSKSSTVQTKTAPCVPAHVQGSVDCASKNVSMSWNQSVGAVSYSAVAQGNAGYASVCNSTGTACVFSDLLCGMNYSLAVSASDGTCVTAPSQPVVLSTVPCKAHNVSVQMSCSANTAVVTWEPSDRVTSHIVRAIGSDGHRINCTSSNDSCILTSMHCGQNYNVTVAALDGACDSSNVFLVLQSAPCAPSNVLTSLFCTTQNYGVVSVSWGQANGAQSYVAGAVSADGHSSSCNSSTTSCDLQGLHCGQIYNVSVYSLANGCQSVNSGVSQVQTAPCAPQNVSAQVHCALRSVQVSWSPAVNADQFRVALVANSTGVISSCNSTGTQCSINNLPCNERFNLSVVAVRGSCQSQPSSSLIASAPCAPQGVNGTIDCITNSAWVSWNVNNGAESYTVLAVGDDGDTSNCSTTNTTCSVPDLGCGKSYNFTVTASNTACQSTPSTSFQLETAPCALSSIVAVANCHSSVIQVQWQRAQIGSSLYIATAEGQDRSLLSCNSSASSCNLTNVQCGMEYTIIVAASSNRCSSLRSPPYKISTAPCQPTAVEAHTECQTNNVFVSWQPSYVAREYALTVVGRSGDRLTNRTLDSNFTLTDLRCGNTYYLSVSASHENCTSVPSPNITFNTLPCKPANLTLGVHCGNRSASLSWTGSVGAVSYVGLAQSDNGTTIYCHSTNTSCSMQGLVCGTVYNFTVKASDGICNSSYSDSLIGGAAPCPPAGLRAVPRQLSNDTQILRASWFAGNCPNSEYLLQVNGGILGNAQALFEVASYWTSRTFFEIPLPCGSSYNATIRAKNFAGSSFESTAVSGTTVPCAPVNVTYSAATTVAWNASIYAINYTVYGVTFSGRTRLCMTSQLLCSVGNISSGHIVVTASNLAGESQDSLPVLVTAGLRRR